MKDASADKAAPPVEPTETLLQTPQVPTGTRPAAHERGAGHARFTPGTMLAGRYRIVSLLGKGGMGEVYRADDVKLGVSVALKFLPVAGHAEPGQLDRFYSEIRIGRQVSHPNVCQIYDLVEIEGHPALAMEYVDGENLASLLRRIGRLPEDKALDVARDLCAGLAAAHDKGVLHRDLKPANVMIDGRGRARITDFGLAALMAAPEDHVLAGTPAYMAPEQLTGHPASQRSDIFALGLILLETFTGKRPFADKSLPEIMAHQRDWEAPRLSSLVGGIDAAVDRVVRRCLAKNPADRPATVREIAAGLPGGDQLHAALAAGRTPSPEVVAAAGETGVLSPAAAAACAAGLVLGFAGLALLAGRTLLLRQVPLKPPEVLADRAQEVLVRAGYPEPPFDSWHAYVRDRDYSEHIARNDRSPARWRVLSAGRPSAVNFAYRSGPRYLIPWGTGGRVDRADPPPIQAGMATVVLDGRGRLVDLAAVPVDTPHAAASGPPDWAALFTEAGLDLAAFKPVSPRPPSIGDLGQKAAWEGAAPERPDVPLRIEAAGHAGRATRFALVWPWTRHAVADPHPAMTDVTFRARQVTYLLAAIAATAGAAFLARRNWRSGRADRRGAFRIAGYVLVCHVAAWLFGADHVPSLEGEWRIVREAVGIGLVEAGQIWLFYLGLEPFVRRRWPETLISWSRLLAGRWRDPLVGRHVLFGLLFAVASQASVHLNALAPLALGQPPLTPRAAGITALAHWRYLPADLFAMQARAVLETVGLLFLLVLLQLVLRRRWLAVAACFALLSLYGTFWRGESFYVSLAFSMVRAAAGLWVLTRFGLLALTVCGAAFYWLSAAPLTLDLSAWYSGLTLIEAAVLLAVAAWAVRSALGGQPLFAHRLLED